MSPPKLAPAASRKWLANGIASFVLVACVVLLVRQFTGNTLREQRTAAQREREAKELAAKQPGNAEAFSTRLEERRRKAEEEQRLAQIKETAAAAASEPLLKMNPAPALPADMPALPAGAPILPTGLPAGAPPAAGASEARLAAHELLKEQAQRDQGRRLGAWEGEQRSALAQEDAGAREAARGAPGAQTAQAAQGFESAGSPALVAALLRAQQDRPDARADARFLQQVATDTRQRPREVLRAEAGPGRHALFEGSLIEVAMRTDVVSDLPGECRAQVTRDVFDSLTGRELLIPSGSRMNCVFNSEVVQGQSRLMLAFHRLIYPNGARVSLGAMQAADMRGASGAPAQVDGHFWKIFGSSMAVAMVTRLAEPRGANAGVTINVSGSAPGTAAGVLAEVARRSLERNINIKPELRLSVGDRLTVVLSRDMVLDPANTLADPAATPTP